jgi:hypothetical protein
MNTPPPHSTPNLARNARRWVFIGLLAGLVLAVAVHVSMPFFVRRTINRHLEADRDNQTLHYTLADIQPHRILLKDIHFTHPILDLEAGQVWIKHSSMGLFTGDWDAIALENVTLTVDLNAMEADLLTHTFSPVEWNRWLGINARHLRIDDGTLNLNRPGQSLTVALTGFVNRLKAGQTDYQVEARNDHTHLNLSGFASTHPNQGYGIATWSSSDPLALLGLFTPRMGLTPLQSIFLKPEALAALKLEGGWSYRNGQLNQALLSVDANKAAWQIGPTRLTLDTIMLKLRLEQARPLAWEARGKGTLQGTSPRPWSLQPLDLRVSYLTTKGVHGTLGSPAVGQWGESTAVIEPLTFSLAESRVGQAYDLKASAWIAWQNRLGQWAPAPFFLSASLPPKAGLESIQNAQIELPAQAITGDLLGNKTRLTLPGQRIPINPSSKLTLEHGEGQWGDINVGPGQIHLMASDSQRLWEGQLAGAPATLDQGDAPESYRLQVKGIEPDQTPPLFRAYTEGQTSPVTLTLTLSQQENRFVITAAQLTDEKGAALPLPANLVFPRPLN